jgi:ankyrin repeat protein
MDETNPQYGTALDSANQDFDAQLWSALHGGDLTAAQAALDAGADIEATNTQGMTPFRFFAGEGKMEQARWLATHGVNVNAGDRLRATALHRTIERDKPELIAELLAMGLDPTLRSASGAPALLMAVLLRNPTPMTNKLLELGVDPNARSSSGTSPVLAAAASKDGPLVLTLLAAGADPHVTDNYGQGILHAMINRQPGALIAEVLKQAPSINVNHAAKSGTTALGLAAEVYDAEAIIVLLNAGADPDTRTANKFGSRPTALMALAATEDNPELPAMKAALAKGASTSMRDDLGRNAAWYATNGQRNLTLLEGEDVTPKQQAEKWQRDNMAITRAALETLIGAGLDPAAPLGADAASPIILAFSLPAGAERAEWIDWAVKAGFPLDPPRFDDGKKPEPETCAPTPLLAAMAGRDLDAICQLLDAGASPSSSSLVGRPAIHLVHRMDRSETEKMAEAILLQRVESLKDDAKAKAKEQIEAARAKVKSEQIEVLRLMTQHSAPGIDAPDDKGRTPLMSFIAAGNQDLAREALALGANPWAQDSEGDTPVLTALKHGEVEMMHALLRISPAPASPALMTGLILDAAFSSPEGGVQRGAFIRALHSLEDEPAVSQWLNARDENGNTPLIVAAATAQEDMVDMLLSMGSDPNEQASDGNTALHHALLQGKSDIVRMLRHQGAKSDIKNAEFVDAHQVSLECRSQFLSRAMTEEFTDAPTKWPLQEETVKRREAGRELWADLVIGQDQPRPSSRRGMLLA